MSISWDDIINTDEYLTDKENITNILKASFGNAAFEDDDEVFIGQIAHLVAVHRYFARHFIEQNDIDDTLFLDSIKNEIGVGIPLTDAIPIKQFLKENKAWFGHKGTELLYTFIGEVVGSPIEVHLPNEMVARWDDPRTCLSGVQGSALDSWDSLKLAYLHDGVYWTRYTYLVIILQSHLITNMNDFLALVESIHPAGTKRFFIFKFQYAFDLSDVSIYKPSTIVKSSYFLRTPYPTLDNNLIASGGDMHCFSMHGGNFWVSTPSVIPIYPLYAAPSYMQIQYEGQLHEQIEDHQNWTFNRRKSIEGDDYEVVYADNDAYLYENQTTNMGAKLLPWGVVSTKTYRELKNIAWDKDQKNQRLSWFQDMLNPSSIEL